MQFLALYVIFFGVWLFFNFKKYRWNLPNMVLALYLSGSICCLCIALFYPLYIQHPDRITFASVMSHILFLFLFMYPLVRYGNELDIDDFHPDIPRLDFFSWCVAVPAVIAMLVSAVDVAQIFLYRDFLAARNAFEAGELSNLYPERFGAAGYLMSLGPQVSFICAVLFCYYFFVLKRRGLITWLLLLGTLAIVTNNLAIAGREGIVRWFLFMAAGMIIVRKHLDISEHRRLIGFVTLAGGAILIFFIGITLDRFDVRYKSKGYGPFFSLLRYGGEQFFLFSYGYQRFFENGYDTVGALFPSVTREVTNMYRLNERVRADFFLNTFSTFVGSFMNRVGFFNTLALALGGFFFFFMSFWKRLPGSLITLTRLVGYTYYYEFVLLGFFYYMHGGAFTQYSFILYLILAYCLSNFTLKSNKALSGSRFG